MASGTASTAEEIAARFPQNAFLLECVSRIYTSLQDEEKALEYARRAVALSPTSVGTHLQLAHACYTFGHWPEAIKEYQAVLELPGGRRGDWLLAYGILLKAAGAPKAEEAFAEALTLAESQEDTVLRGCIAEARGKRAEAAQLFRQYLSQSPLPVPLRRKAEAGLQRVSMAEE